MRSWVGYQAEVVLRIKVRPQRLLRRLAAGHLQNVRFRDAQRLVERLGFDLARVSGSHHVYVHPRVPGPVNLQNLRGQAKPYQLRQVLRLTERYNLRLEDES